MIVKSQKIDNSRFGDGKIRMMHLHQSDREPHAHTFFELVYVLHGTAIHYWEQDAVPLRAGDYFIIDPGSEHRYQNTKELEIVNCLFLPEYIDRALVDCPSLAALLSNQAVRFGVPVDIHVADRILHDSDQTVGRLIRKMEQEYEKKDIGYMEQLRCYLTQILVCAVRTTVERSMEKVQHSITGDIANYLQQNYAQPLSLEAIAKQFGYTPQYLSSMFRKDTGMTLQVFLQRLRVEEACRLMEQTDVNLAGIAQSVGYTDPKHFSKIFRRHKNLSVKEYRAGLR